jgi:hypothetical protein
MEKVKMESLISVNYSIRLNNQIMLRINMQPSTVVTKKFLFFIDRPIIAVNVIADLLADGQVTSTQSYTVHMEGDWDTYMVDAIVRTHMSNLVNNAYVRGRPFNPFEVQ